MALAAPARAAEGSQTGPPYPADDSPDGHGPAVASSAKRQAAPDFLFKGWENAYRDAGPHKPRAFNIVLRYAPDGTRLPLGPMAENVPAASVAKTPAKAAPAAQPVAPAVMEKAPVAPAPASESAPAQQIGQLDLSLFEKSFRPGGIRQRKKREFPIRLRVPIPPPTPPPEPVVAAPEEPQSVARGGQAGPSVSPPNVLERRHFFSSSASPLTPSWQSGTPLVPYEDTPALSSVPPTAMRSGGVKYPWRTPGAAAAPGARASPLGTSPVAPAPLAPTPRAIQMPPVTPATAPLAEKHAMVEVGLQTTPGLGLIAANREGQAGVIASLSPVDGGAARSPAAAVAPSPARLPIPDERLLEGLAPAADSEEENDEDEEMTDDEDVVLAQAALAEARAYTAVLERRGAPQRDEPAAGAASPGAAAAAEAEEAEPETFVSAPAPALADAGCRGGNLLALAAAVASPAPTAASDGDNGFTPCRSSPAESQPPSEQEEEEEERSPAAVSPAPTTVAASSPAASEASEEPEAEAEPEQSEAEEEEPAPSEPADDAQTQGPSESDMDLGGDSDDEPTAEASSPGSPDSRPAPSTAASTPATEPLTARSPEEEEPEPPATEPLRSAAASPDEAEAQQQEDDHDNGDYAPMDSYDDDDVTAPVPVEDAVAALAASAGAAAAGPAPQPPAPLPRSPNARLKSELSRRKSLANCGTGVNEQGVRRSRRDRIAPLEWWRNEQVVYSRAESKTLPTVSKVVVRRKDAVWPAPSSRKAQNEPRSRATTDPRCNGESSHIEIVNLFTPDPGFQRRKRWYAASPEEQAQRDAEALAAQVATEEEAGPARKKAKKQRQGGAGKKQKKAAGGKVLELDAVA